MKTSLSVILLACAGLLLGGCASGPSRLSSSKTGPSTATNTTAASTGTNEESPEETLNTGKGNPESLAHYAAAISYETNGQEALAEEEYYKSVMADPANEVVALKLAEDYLRQQHPDKAVALLTKVAARRDASAIILSWLARCDLQAGKTNAAIAASRLAVQRRPDSLDASEAQLEIWVQTGKTAEALRTLERANRHVRNQPADLIALADLYASFLRTQAKESGNARQRATALLSRAAAMKISEPALLDRMADTYGRLGDATNAAAIWNKLVEQAPPSSAIQNAFREKMARIYMDAQDWTNAAKEFKAVVREDPIRYPAPEAWYYLGIMAHSVGNLADASDDFENAIRAEPGIELAYYRLALVKADMNRPEEALAALNLARTRFTNNFDAEFFTGLVFTQLKDFAEAVRHLTAAEVMARVNNPSRLDQNFYFQLGAACERNHQYEQASGYLQKSVDLAPDNAEALNYLGFMWADRGENLAKARAYIEKAVKLDPKNAAYLDSLGWVLYKLKQPQEALPWMLKAVEFSDKPDPTILDHLGDVYMSVRQPAKALEAWKKSLDVESNPDVKKKLQLFDAGAT